jgi:hypothetical protein
MVYLGCRPHRINYPCYIADIYLQTFLLAVSRLAAPLTLTHLDYVYLLNLRRKYAERFLYAFGLTFIGTNTGQGTHDSFMWKYWYTIYITTQLLLCVG